MEILAPAGGFDAVVAAVQNGADAVYFGGKDYNARQRADNFDAQAFRDAVQYCHIRGVKVYQTLNTLLYDDQLSGLMEVLHLACEVGVDALIVQDLGVATLAKRCCPHMPIHGSTQMTVHTVKGAQFCKEFGMERVVLARELTLGEIKTIAKEVEIELEVFGHGALCMSVSGQCYMSAMIGTRSGNRGSCAGSCRLPFGCERIEDYDLSLKDLCAANSVQALQEIGVTSLKIEGRMKRPEYVAAATASYVALNQGRPADLSILEAVFSRNGFTDGYLQQKIDGNMFGVRGKDDVLSATEQVFAALRQSYHKEQPLVPVSMQFIMQRGQVATLSLTDGTQTATATSDIAQEAQHRSLTAESAKDALGKLGGTPFLLQNFSAAVDEGLMAPKSALNAMRREVVDELLGLRANRPKISFTPCKPFEKASNWIAGGRIGRFTTVKQVDWSRWEQVILPLEEVWKNQEILLTKDVWIELPRVQFAEEEVVLNQLGVLQARGFTQIAANNPAHLQLAKEYGFAVFGMPFLNVTNTVAAQTYASLGVEQLTLSFEMTAAKAVHVTAPIPLGQVVYGRLPLMITRNCPVKRHGGCGSCNGTRELTDRLGNRFPVRCTNRRFAEVYNCKTIWLSDKQNDFSGFQLFYFTEESLREIDVVLDTYQNRQAPKGDFTRGLYYRKTT